MVYAFVGKMPNKYWMTSAKQSIRVLIYLTLCPFAILLAIDKGADLIACSACFYNIKKKKSLIVIPEEKSI